MKCFYHQNKDAIGVCKTCYKGLCGDCAVDVTNGIACKDKCEEKVKELNATFEKNKSSYLRASQAYLRNALVQLMLGLLFLIIGLMTKNLRPTYGIFLIISGIIFFLSSFWYFSLLRKMDKH